MSEYMCEGMLEDVGGLLAKIEHRRIKIKDLNWRNLQQEKRIKELEGWNQGLNTVNEKLLDRAKRAEKQLEKVRGLPRCYFIPDEIDGTACVSAVETTVGGYVLAESIKAIIKED